MLKRILIIALILIPAAALAADSYSDYDRDYRLSSIKTFQFAEPLGGNSLNEKRLRTGFTDSFARIGIRQSDVDPDVIVVYYAGAVEKRRVVGYGGAPFWGPRRAWTEDYVDGTAVVDFLDARTHQLIWRGKVTAAITLNSVGNDINNGMERLARAFRKDRERQARDARQ